MSKEIPENATHKCNGVYLKAVDFEFGSFQWWNSFEWVTQRNYPPSKIEKV